MAQETGSPKSSTLSLRALHPELPSSVDSPYPSALIEALELSIEHHVRERSCGALLLVSIDNLAMILSGYGHDVSENTVKGILGNIQHMLNAQDVLLRLQRDQFAIVLHHSFPEETERMAGRIAHVMQNFGREHGEASALHVIGTVGAVHFPRDAANAIEVVDKAYVALHSTQESFFRPFSNAVQEADLCRQQMGLASYLYSALQEDRLRLAWQPVIEAKTGRISHYEALLRLVALNGKITSAGALIPVAEKMGLIEAIDSLVLDMVARELRACPDVSLAFNVSNLTTENPIWMERLQALIKETPEIASRMVVEITETAMHRDLRRAAFFVAALQSLGAQVALDDFGSGYTSFRQIKALSVDMVKIDGVFIKDLPYNADNRFFVKTLLEFTRGFALPSVAEFVESGDTAKLLMEYGIDYMQGYYFGKPELHRRWLTTGEYRKD